MTKLAIGYLNPPLTLAQANATYAQVFTPEGSGAIGDGVHDDTTALTAFTAAVVAAGGVGVGARGKTYRITGAVPVPLGFGYTIDLGGATIRQATDNTPIFRYTKEGAHSFRVTNFVADWDNNQPVANTNAIVCAFDPDTNTGAGFYNFQIDRIHALRGYAVVSQLDPAVTNPLWGCDISHIFRDGAVTGPTVQLSQTAAGQPNVSLRHIYGNLANAATDSIICRGVRGLVLNNIEVNNIARRAVLIDACEAVTLAGFHAEAGHFAAAYEGIVVLSNSRAVVNGVDVQAVSFDTGGAQYGFAVRVTNGGRATITGLTMADCVLVGATQAAGVQGDDAGAIDVIDYSIQNGIYVVYPYDNTPLHTNRVGQQIALPTKAGALGDGDFIAPRDGLAGVDTTNSRLYVRTGGAWKSVAVT